MSRLREHRYGWNGYITFRVPTKCPLNEAISNDYYFAMTLGIRELDNF